MGRATYYRGIYKQLHALGHHVTFAEPDAYDRLQNRDTRADFSYVRTVVYKHATTFPRCSARPRRRPGDQAQWRGRI